MIIEYIPATATFDTLICAIYATTDIGSDDIARKLQSFNTWDCGLYIVCDGRRNEESCAGFHETLFDRIVRQYRTVVSIRGLLASAEVAGVSGRDIEAAQRVRIALKLPEADTDAIAAEESVEQTHPSHPSHLINRGTSGAGIQIAINTPLMYHTSPIRTVLIDTIAKALLRPRRSTRR